jgi:Winged helix DNA-binding domain
LKDFTWWSGLTGADARAGLATARPQLVEEQVDGQTCWLAPSSPEAARETSPAVHLLPNYDEYVVSYANRSAIYDPQKVKKVDERGNFLFNHTIVIDGQVAGTWKRTFKKGAVEITPNLFAPISAAASEALSAEMGRFSRFLAMPMVESH